MHDHLLLFDPTAELTIVERRLPHWSQAGVACFITFRTNDSIPADVLNRWRLERMNWLRRHSINPQAADWLTQLRRLPIADQQDFHRTFADHWHGELDRGHGECVLCDPINAKIVADSLLYFDNDRYLATDFVVMPNHVHLLAAFPGESAMLNQCESWKHFTATQINRRLDRKGRLWQQDGFDHLPRSEEQYRYLQRYIADNPRKAKLKLGEFFHYQNAKHAPK